MCASKPFLLIPEQFTAGFYHQLLVAKIFKGLWQEYSFNSINLFTPENKSPAS